MKKVLSIVLALVMVLGTFASAVPALAEGEAPAEAAPESPYTVLALNLKNKTGVTIDECYIYPVGAEDKGASVVAAGWPDKDADGENYEKNIYIVREAGKEMEVYVVFADGTNATWQVGELAMYDKLSMKKGTDVSKWEHEANDDPEDQAKMALLVALGKTADAYYPGYVTVGVELKNKSGKNIKELYFYEEGGAKEAYPNIVGNARDLNDELITLWGQGRPYIFTYFIRPAADNYVIYAVFEDDTFLEYPIDDWNKPDGDGFFPNEISLKSYEDPDDIKIKYDGDVEKDSDMTVPELLAASALTKCPGDEWFPVYAGAPEVDPELVAAAKAALHVHEEEAEEPAAEPAAEAPAEVYTALGLKFKNKYGVAFKEAYLYPAGAEDKGGNIIPNGLLSEGQGEEGTEETVVYVYRETAKLGAMALYIVPVEGDPFEWLLPAALGNNFKITVKGASEQDSWKVEEITKDKDLAKIADVVALGVTSDGFVPAN